MEFRTGTTVVALKFKDGIIVAADRKVTAGMWITHGEDLKIHKISDRIVLAAAGVVADIQILAKILSSNINLKELKTNKPVYVKEAASLLSIIMYQNKLFPFLTEIVLAGKDENGYNIYVLDEFGGITMHKFTSVGSGSVFALGVLESMYKDDLSLEEAKKLAIDALMASIKRDSFTGKGIDIAIITEEGIKTESYKLTEILKEEAK